MRNFVAMWLAYLRSFWKVAALLFVCVFVYQHINAENRPAEEPAVAHHRQ